MRDVLFEVDHLFFSYESGPDSSFTIKDVSVFLEKHRFIGILGSNGCGKTTFLDLISRHLKPFSGTILFMNRPLTGWTPKAFSKEVALVPQDFYVNFPYTVEEVVMMGRHPYLGRFSVPDTEDKQKVSEALKDTDLICYRHADVTRLSAGERQRVLVARALAQDTPVLILDEPTSNLDIHHALYLMDSLSDLVKKGEKTVITVFQDINLAARYCDDLIMLKDGEMIASGPVEHTLTPDAIDRTFGVSSKVYEEPFSGVRAVAFKM